jgi:hypothetical protein
MSTRRNQNIRQLVIPTRPPLFKFEGWALYKHDPTDKDSPLWVPLKLVHLDRAHLPRRRGAGQRAYWLYWGVDVARLRRSKYSRKLADAQPAVFAAITAWLATQATPAWLEGKIGADALAVARERMAVSRAKHAEHDRLRYEAAHAAALEEDAAWEALYNQ